MEIAIEESQNKGTQFCISKQKPIFDMSLDPICSTEKEEFATPIKYKPPTPLQSYQSFLYECIHNLMVPSTSIYAFLTPPKKTPLYFSNVYIVLASIGKGIA
jgi:hypothetical protein